MSFIIESSIVGSILVGLILIIRLLLKEHMKKSIIYYLWFILIIKLLVPFGPESKLSLFNLINITSKEETNLSVNNYRLPEKEVNNNISTIINSSVNNKVDLNTESKDVISNNEVKSNINKNSSIFSYKEILFIIWVIGVIIITSKILISYLKLKLSISKEYNEYKNYDLKIDISTERKILKINKNIDIRITNEINSPSLCGIINPKILIPLNMINNLNNDEMRYIILHELCHYKRKDVLISWLGYIVKVIHWFNPIIYMGLNIMTYDCEAACDEMVLSKLNDKENIKYGNTILNVLNLINARNRVPGTTSMVTNKKRLKDRVKFIAENKKFNYKTVLLGIIAIVILSSVALTNKLTRNNLNLVDSSNIQEVTIRVIPSSPKEKRINKNADIKKIVDYINSIKVKDKKQEIYKGWEISIILKSDREYNIYFTENTINIDGIQYTVDSKIIENIKKLYSELNYEEENVVKNEEKNSNNNSYEVFLNKVKSDGYNIVSGSSFGGRITLPNEVNPSISIYEGYNKSLENGYNLEHYLGTEVNLISFYIDNTEGIQEVIGLLNDDSLIGYWLSPIYNKKGESEVNKILNELGIEAVEDISYIKLTKYLGINFGLKVEEISKNTLTTKDNGYSAESYTIKVNDEELKVYEYNDERAALSEISLLNEDDYSEISYATDYILINMEELRKAKQVYFKDEIICLYNGDNTEIKDALSSILEEPLNRLSRDKIRISSSDITFIYPADWIGKQEPIEIIIGEDNYIIDDKLIKQNKNICEAKINNDLLQKIMTFDGEKILIKWKDKISNEEDKAFITEINRENFIRVVKIQGGYIDSSLVYPEIEINSTDKEVIGKKLYEEYIKLHSTDWFFNLNNGINKEPELSALESKINSVSVTSEGQYIFTVCISYDIKAANEKSPWYAGNGEIGENNWIVNKVTFIDIEKTGENKYRIINGYTG